jgi:hypothetical protein
MAECDETVLPPKGVGNDCVLVPSLVTGRSFCLSAFFASIEVASGVDLAVDGRPTAGRCRELLEDEEGLSDSFVRGCGSAGLVG